MTEYIGKDRNTEPKLTASTNLKLRQLCQQGYQQLDAGNSKQAIRLFYCAWTLLPKPQTQWQEAGWVLTALGDAYFKKADYKNGEQALLSALHCPKALGNPIIHLRLGQCLYEMGDLPKALEQFQQVVQYGGTALFSTEENKYLQHLKTAKDV
jgi:tetratricopeptide (TPR) repeat protein